MATYDQLMIYKQAYDLVTDLMPLTKNMDRGYKFTLGERINNASAWISSVNSYLGVCKHYNTYRLRQSLIERFVKDPLIQFNPEMCIVRFQDETSFGITQ